jgi:type IV pilus assembly protein PilW
MVELMVAVVIGMVGMVALFQLSKMAEGQRRSTISGSDAQSNGMFAMYALQGDLRQAGYGLNWNVLLDCAATNAYDATRSPATLPTFPVAPVIIDAAANATQSDTVTILYSSSQQVTSPAALTSNPASATASYPLQSRFGYALGDLVLLAERRAASVPIVTDCIVAQVSGLPAGNANIEHADGASYPYNKPDAFGISFTTNARVFNLGPSPVRNVYAVVGNDLTVRNFLNSATANVLAPQIVQMRAQYCKDTDGNTTTDVCNTTTPANATEWRQVLSVRVAVVARSAQPEKPSGGGACDTTTTAPTWQGGSFNLTAAADWQCYRYQVFETTVPLRNQIWFQQ